MWIIVVFIIGYACIALESILKLNKAATALLTGVICWTICILSPAVTDGTSHLAAQLSEIAGVLFFLLGAMTIVELIDSHEGFEVITDRITTLSRRKLLLIVAIVAFLLSAVLDNLTTAIVMTALLRKLVSDKNDRWMLAGAIIIAANAGGAWSPIGDVTTTMLWIGGQIEPASVIVHVFIPSLVSLVLPLAWFWWRMKGDYVRAAPVDGKNSLKTSTTERYTVFACGLLVFLMVPVFKTLTGLPPFMGVMMGVGILWVITEIIHKKKNDEHKSALSVAGALQRIDTPSILFFLGILLAVAALDEAGHLHAFSAWVDHHIHNLNATSLLFGLGSSIIDNVPLVAAAQGMYPPGSFPDHYFWELLAYCAGTGGSILIIGSAAGVAVMGVEKISFGWYLRKISLPALLGYLAGAGIFILMN